MMLEDNDVSLEVFGLAGTFPRPGWVVLDAARQHGFTGELTFETIPAVKVYLDGGLIYLAERVTDPSLGSRLIDAGALNAAQLEHGSMLVGDVAHLGRLFERVPSVNRHTVMVMTEMMTEECVGWLAGQVVSDVETAPYRHHPAGVQRWLQPPAGPELAPGDPLPSPPADEAPEPLFAPGGLFDDPLITWDQPSWLDEPAPDKPPIDLLADVTGTEHVAEPELSATEAAADEVAPEAETTDASYSASWLATDPTSPIDAESERFEPLAAPVPVEAESVAVQAPFAPPAPAAVAVQAAFAAPAPEAVPVFEAFAAPAPVVAGDPAADTVGQTVADAPEPEQPASATTISDDWADLVAAVTESDETEAAPPTPATESPDIQDGWPPAPMAFSNDWADLLTAVTEPEPLPVRTPTHSPSLGQLDQEPDVPTVGEPELAPSIQTPAAPVSQADQAPSSVMGDWVDHLDADGLPEPGSEVLMTTKRLPPVPVVPADRFELIWPSGEVDEQFGSSDSASTTDRHPDLDRAGPTARLATPTDATRAAVAATLEHGQLASELTYDEATTGHDEITDEVVLAVRRAVASIETSSLDARRRLVSADAADAGPDLSRGIGDRTIRSLRPVSETSDALTPIANSARRVPTRSVFDDDDTVAMPESVPPQVPAAPVVEPEVERVGALRRLIGSLRRR